MIRVGDKVRHVTRKRDGVVTELRGEFLVMVDFGAGKSEVATIGNLKLLRKLTEVEKIQERDPKALLALVPFVKRVVVEASPDAAYSAATDISSSSSLSLTDALERVHIVTERSHGVKYDVIVDEVMTVELADRLGLYFNLKGHRARKGEVQIGSKSLALWLFQNANLHEGQAV